MAFDAQDRISYVNRAAERLLRWPASDLLGQPSETIVPARLHQVEGLSFHRHLLARARAQEGRALRAPVLRRDGLEIDVEVTLEAVEREGRGQEIIASLRTIHEPVASGQVDGEPYRLVFENAPIGIFHFDAGGVITACNSSFVRILGSSRQVLIGLNMQTLPDLNMLRCVREALQGRAASYEGEYRSATAGKLSVVRVQFSPILGSDGQVAGGVGIVEDVTERRQIEARLAHASRMASVGTLAAGVAHEINNPLAFVTTSLDLAARELRSSPATALSHIANAREGSERVRVIVRDLKSFSRTDADACTLVDLERVIDSAISLAWNEIRHRAKFTRRCNLKSPVWAHDHRLTQVFVNLLVNAAQAIPEGDDANAHEISIHAFETGNRVVVEVRDTGVGIDPAKRERIFEPFWTDKPVGKGTGLGLSICHGIITSYDGEISVESGPGRGSTLRVTLPARPGESVSAPCSEDLANAVPSRRSRILVIDDEPRLSWTLARALDHHDVVTAESGRAALALLARDQDFDLILCDMMMPDFGGSDVYEEVRRLSAELAERIVFMTGGVFTDRARTFLEQSSRKWLEKPFRMEQVEALLRSRSP